MTSRNNSRSPPRAEANNETQYPRRLRRRTPEPDVKRERAHALEKSPPKYRAQQLTDLPRTPIASHNLRAKAHRPHLQPQAICCRLARHQFVCKPCQGALVDALHVWPLLSKIGQDSRTKRSKKGVARARVKHSAHLGAMVGTKHHGVAASPPLAQPRPFLCSNRARPTCRGDTEACGGCRGAPPSSSKLSRTVTSSAMSTTVSRKKQVTIASNFRWPDLASRRAPPSGASLAARHKERLALRGKSGSRREDIPDKGS